MFSWLFGNEALIKENQELRKELSEIRQKEFLHNIFSTMSNFNRPLGSLGDSLRSPSSPGQRIMRGLDK